MRKTLRLARREYKAAVRTKGFIIGLVLVPIFMSGGLITMAIFEHRVDTTDRTIAVIDHSGIVAQAIVQAANARNTQEIYDKDTGKKTKPGYIIEIVEPNASEPDGQRLELSDRVRSRGIHAFLEVGPQILHPGDDAAASSITYHSENAALDDIRTWIAWPINIHLRNLRLAEAGVDTSAIKDVFGWLGVEGRELVSVDEKTGEIKGAEPASEAKAVAVPLAIIMLMFIMTLMGAVPLLHAVMEEKTQRITEVLLGSVTPFEFMMGKVLGGLAVSLTASAVYVFGGALTLGRMGLSGFIPYDILPWFFAFMLLNITMMGSVFAALGSTCSDAKDAQSMAMPAMVPVVIPMFLLTPIMREPLGSLATSLSLFPPFTPMLMLMRQSTPGSVPMWQPWIGLAGVVIFTTISIWAGGRIMRIGILMQGKPPNLVEILRWAVRG